MQNIMFKLAPLFSLLTMLCISDLAGVEMLLKTTTLPNLAKANREQDAVGIQQIDQILTDHHVGSIKPVFDMPKLTDELSRWVICEFKDEKDLQQAQNSLTLLKSVLYAQPNRIFRLDFIPNDSLYEQQYALAKINAPNAWELERGNSEVLIAVIDTGIDYDHPDLANLWMNAGEDVNGNGRVDDLDFNHVDDDGNGFIDDLRGWDFTDAPNYPDQGDYLERDNNPMDEHGHGTGVAGIIAAEADNVVGIAGLAHDCRILNLRAFNSSGYGEEDDVASALLYAVSL
ncbi:MAG: hypothetical protein EHM72_01310, partial [Calditrichaeota bacterium]